MIHIDEFHVADEPCDCYVAAASYEDGTELDADELTDLNEGFDGYEIWFEHKLQQADFNE
jgi:hypothetical protein